MKASDTNGIIFLVDDNEFFSAATALALEKKLSIKVKCFNNAELMFEDLHLKPVLIILDYHLDNDEGMSGEEALEGLKNSNISVPIVMLSAQKDQKTAARLLKKGAVDYIEKGDEFVTILIHCIQNIFRISELSRNVSSLNEKSKKLSKRLIFAVVSFVLSLALIIWVC